MPLFTPDELTGGRGGPQPSETDRAGARLLLSAIQRTCRLQRAYNLDTWAQYFRKLRDADGIPLNRLEPVLQWYCANMGGKFMPVVHSAQSFRQKWPAIEAAYLRALPPPKAAELSPELQGLLIRLRRKHWPLGSGSQLPTIVGTSAERYTMTRRTLRQYHASLVINDADYMLSRYVCSKMSTTASFLDLWFDRVHQRVVHWEDWSGDLEYFVFDIHHPMFQQLGAGWAAAYTSNASRWYRLIERSIAHANHREG